jgi:1-acyl-sn-glycerol-3-phosphate acyltransferase
MKLKALVRAAYRGTHFVLHMTLGLLFTSAYRLRYGQHWHQTPAGQTLISWWMQCLIHLLGIRINRYGRPLATNVLFVSNHISFLDIVVIASHVPVRFLAKHNVRHWPIFGYLAALSGSLFIHRGKRRELNRTLTTIKQAMSEARPVLIFPEGTTSLGNQVLKFHSGLFQAAIDSHVPVQPVTLHYRRNQQVDRIAAYIEQDNFLISLLRLMAQAHTEVHLSFTPPVDSHGHTRQSLAAFCQARISQNLQYQLQTPDTQPEFDPNSEFAILGECEQ